MRNLFFLGICCLCILMSCKNSDESSNEIFVGGQIVNPETDYIILSKENKPIDTIYLDERNQFGKSYEDLSPGIYTFKHPPENQIMYVEPGDSLLIWLNTLDFDKSLNFSGDGAEKSSFLLDMFLLNQKNNDLILRYYKIEPAKFAKITDSIKERRIAKLNKLKEGKELSEEFLKIAESSINLEHYDLRERYTFLIRKYFKKYAEKIPEDFNDYRENINFNNAELQDYYVYTNLIDDYLRAKSIEYCEENGDTQRDCYNLSNYKNIERRIILIDSLTNLTCLKNEFLDRLAVQSITMAENKSRIDSILKLLGKIDYTNIKEARNLARIQKSYLLGESIATKGIMKPDGKISTYGQLLSKPSIIYTWSIFSPSHHKWQHKLIEDLREKYPEIDFYGNNIDANNSQEWLQAIENNGYNANYEIQIANRTDGTEVYEKYLNKVLLVDKNGKVIQGDLQLNPPAEFEKKLLEFISQ